MSRRSSLFRVLTFVGMLLLFLAGVADALSGKACPHHAHDDVWHGPSPTQESAGGERTEGESHHVDHSRHLDHAGHAQGHAGHDAPDDSEEGGHDSPECDCGFLCTSVSTPLVVQAPQSETGVLAPVVHDVRLHASQDYDGNLSTTSIPFFLPYSNGPPVEA